MIERLHLYSHTLTCCGFLGLPGPLFGGSAGAGSGCSCDPEGSPAVSSPRSLIVRVRVGTKLSLAHLPLL